MNKKIFLNLSNGILKLNELELNEVSFIRIQSTTLENKNYIKLLSDLDHNFLLHLALGFECEVYDYGTNRICSKSIYTGVELIRYCLNRFWFGIIPDKVYKKCKDGVYHKTITLDKYFDDIYNKLFVFDNNREKEHLKTKLKYYKKFLNCKEINLNGYSSSTNRDGDWKYFFEILKSKI